MLRAVTEDVAVIETEALHLQGHEGEVLMQFHAGSSLRTDFGNWYVPTIDALHNLCHAAGFARVSTIIGPPAPPSDPPPDDVRTRMARRIGRIPAPKPSAPSANYRAVVHAFAD